MDFYSDDSDDDSDAFGGAGVPSQYQTGYNSYGRPSMTLNNSFQQQSSEDDGSGASSDDNVDSNDDEPAAAAAAPVQPRGKTFRPPVGAGDSSSSSEDEGYLKPSGNDEAIATAQVVNLNLGPPRGKELAMMLKGNDDSSSDDEPLATKKSKPKAKPKGGGNNGAKKKSAPPKDAAAKAPAKKAAPRKRKAPPAARDSDSGSDDEDPVAAVVCEGSDEDVVMAVAENIKSSKRAKANEGAAKKKGPAKKAATKKGGAKGKPSSKKGSSAAFKKSPPPSNTSASAALLASVPEVSAEKADAARKAREALQEAVTSLPHAVAEGRTVRSFGRIKPEWHGAAGSSPLDALYSSPHAIYPVGFSCDRMEFSPVHGRTIRMRCDILDGSGLREEQEKMECGGAASSGDGVGGTGGLGDGPVFRVTWGEGVEEDGHPEPSCPFDPYVASAHLGGDVDAIAVPLSSKKGKPVGLPEVGMRVIVRFDRETVRGGGISEVRPAEKKGKNKKVVCNITIQYDDGVSEIAAFPDPDINVAHQGCPPVETANGLVTEMNGKLVRSVLAKNPLEAWGKTLLSLGLIDEIMFEAALQELQLAREEGFSDAIDRRKEKLRRSNRQSLEGNDDISHGTDADAASNTDKMESYNGNTHDRTPTEVELCEKLLHMRKRLEDAKRRSKAAALNLANARISTISPFAANPFLCRHDAATTEASWLAAAIRKERAKMGNTGNKRKIVTPATLLDKSDTFFIPKIEKLVEGLPGTEFAPSYVFRANRSAASSGNQANQAWVQEAKIRHQKQQQKKQEKELEREEKAKEREEKAKEREEKAQERREKAQERQEKAQEKAQERELERAQKAAKLAENKAKAEQERELKRKMKEEEAEAKKRMREEEEEKRRRERVEKRLSQLSLQMDDRLFKEACVMRERNIMNLVRGMNKEFVRRRRAAEVAVGNQIDRSTEPPSINSPRVLAPFGETLPPLSKAIYDVEAVRVWDFLHSFSDAFSKPDKPFSLPSLDSIQDAINCIRGDTSNPKKRSNSVKLFKAIAIDLCKVISPTLTKILSSSVPNADIVGKNGTDSGPQEDADVSCLPVTEWSWREIARMAIIYDVLTDLGYTKQESANLVKGYRSGGHPNSKEARRWKKIEESPVVMLYQHLQHREDETVDFRRRIVRASLSIPCAPSSVPSDWRFFLHNVKSRSSNSQRFIKDNVSKALAGLKKISSVVKDAESYIADLEKCLAILERAGQGSNSVPELHKAKQIAVGVLDSTREKCSPLALKSNQEVSQHYKTHLVVNQTDATQAPSRQRMGFQKMYQMSKEQFKALELSKEQYMEAALRLKEELEAKNKDDADEDDDDDDDEDEDGDGAEGEKPDKESEPNKSEPKKVSNGEVSSAGDAQPNDNSTQDEKRGDVVHEPVNDEEDSPADSSSDKPTSMAAETEKLNKAKKDTEADVSSDNPVNSSDVVQSFHTTNHPTVSEKDEQIPTERAEGFPDGWIVRRIPRLNPSDKRTDRNWYSPILGLKFRAKADALRFLGKLESAKGDEGAAIMEYHGKNKPNKVANKAANKKSATKALLGEGEGDTKVEYDFCEDIPVGPELIRRCLAVIRSLCASNSSDQFVYPVDPQLYPGYYETVMNPMSLYDIGKYLQAAGDKFSLDHDDPEIEEVVAEVGRKVRTIVHNTLCVNSTNSIVNSAEEMLRLFERLIFDWVLAPSAGRPDLQDLDDDRCIDHHESDINSMVLLCDACEGKYNMSRLKPALSRVPSGDWYCPRCVSGRSWLTVDPRIGRRVENGSFSGTVQSCKFLFAEEGKPSILYCIKASHSGCIEYWGIEDVDEALVGGPVEPLRCLQALAESPGYGFGRDSGIVGGAVPLAINPLVVDKAAQAALTSGVFKDTVSACVSLTNPPEDLTAEEWTTLLMLLVTKCSQCDDLQELSSKLENEEASRLSNEMMTFWRARAAKNIVPNHHDNDTDDEEESLGAPPGDASDIPSVIENKINKTESPRKKEESQTEIVTKSSGDEASFDGRPANMEISFQSSTEGPDETSSSNAPNAEEILRRQREAAFLDKTRREKKREEALMGYYVGNRLKSTAASFEEDVIATIVKSSLCDQEEGLNLSAVRCRELCHYCGLSDVALGAPLCRTPDENEWRETFPQAVHDRTTYMIAEIPDKSSNASSTKQENGVTPPEIAAADRMTKVLTVRVRVGGELVTSKNKCIDNAVKNFDSAMQQFLPKNPIGFQSELRFRHEWNLSILSGSLAAHEACAMSAHRSRKEKLLTERRNIHRVNMTREAALACGKSIPIGNDPFGRSYWVFSADPTSLFVCQVDSKPGDAMSTRKQWHRFHMPEEIASVIVCLGKGPLYESLKEIFPKAAKVVKDRSWSTLLFGRMLHSASNVSKGSPSSKEPKAAAEEQVDYGAPFVEDEDVLVESANGKLLWDAVVVDVSKDPETERVNGYLVHYKKWSSRFDQWVVPDRVVEPNKVNLEVQEEVLQDFSTANDVAPHMLERLFAYKFLNAKKRARPTPASKNEIFESAFTRPSASCDEKLLGFLKGAILLIEAALPRGSVGPSTNGSWNPQTAALWRNLVKDAQGPESLMKCVLVLEDAISPDWLHSQATQLYAAVPKQWRAMGEATLPAIALRVSILDRCLKYQQKKKKQFD